MIPALLLVSVLGQGSATMAGPHIRALSSGDYFASLMAANPGTQCDGTALVWSDNTAITTTRASTAYCTAADGTMSLLTSNQPRVSNTGLLVEGSRTNIVLRSEAMDHADWAGAATVTANSHAGPWGGTTMETVDSVLAGQNRYQCPNVSSSVGPFVTSAFGRAVSGTHAATFTVTCTGGHNATSCSCYRADGTACTPTTSGTQCRGTSTFTTTVDRMTVVSSCASAVTQICFEFFGSTVAGTGAHVWSGAQHEAAVSFSSSYIPTAGTAVARSADLFSFTPGTSMDAAGCFSAIATYGAVFPGTNRWLSTSGGIALGASDATTIFADDGTNDATAVVVSVVGRAVTARGSWAASTLSVQESGGTAGTDTFDGTMGGSTAYLGSTSGTSNFLWGHIKSARLGTTLAGCVQ
jgi:hypothetical protein